MSLNCQYIQRYYWSSVNREDAEKALALLELLLVINVKKTYQFKNQYKDDVIISEN